MAHDEFYDDLEDVRAGAGHSFGRLPPDEQAVMLEGLQDISGLVGSHVVVSTDDDPSAIVVPEGHRHDTIFAPDGIFDNAEDDPLGHVKAAHRAELCTLSAYEAIENFATRLKYSARGTHRAGMTASDLVLSLRACYPKGFECHADGVYFIFELDVSAVFYLCVRFGDGTNVPSDVPQQAEWTEDVAKTVGPVLTGTLEEYAFFECECV